MSVTAYPTLRLKLTMPQALKLQFLPAVPGSNAAAAADRAEQAAQNAQDAANTAVAATANKVDKSGDTMSGFLTLNANPTAVLHAATKQYVDAATSTGIADGDKGDLTVSGGGTVWTIDADAVTYAKIQNISASPRFLGRFSGGAGDVQEGTGTQATALLDVFTSTLKGLAPLSGGGTANFLRADGSWAAPPGGGGTGNVTYTASTTAPASPNAGDLWYDLSTGVLSIYVNDGSSLQWVMVAPSGSSGPVLRSYSDGLINGALQVSAAGSALTVAVKTIAGADPSAGDPVTVLFRNATGTTGDFATLTLTAAASLTVSSGSTLGATSATAFRLWIVGFNDAGIFRLGVINCVSISGTTVYPLTEGIASSTAESGAGAADSAGVIYTGTAVSAKAMRILGYAEWSSSGLTAGTWTTTNLLRVQLFGPGIKKPGDTVQSAYNFTTTATSTTSSTFQNTNSSIVITPTSAANIISAIANGIAQAASSNLTAPNARFHRGSTAIGNSGGCFLNVAQALSISVGLQAWDAPNTTSATTYMVKLSSSDNVTSVVWAQTGGFAPGGAAMTVQEIMA